MRVVHSPRLNNWREKKVVVFAFDSYVVFTEVIKSARHLQEALKKSIRVSYASVKWRRGATIALCLCPVSKEKKTLYQYADYRADSSHEAYAEQVR